MGANNIPGTVSDAVDTVVTTVPTGDAKRCLSRRTACTFDSVTAHGGLREPCRTGTDAAARFAAADRLFAGDV